MLKRHVYDSSETLYDFIASELKRYSEMPVAQHICLSGGSTPKAMFRFIIERPYRTQIHWHNLHFWWGDERCVPADHPESNYGQAKLLLFDHIDIPEANIHPIIPPDLGGTKLALPENVCQQALDDFIADLNKLLEKKSPLHDAFAYPRFDWVLLGVGEDGHTASLFPADFDDEDNAAALLVTKPGTSEYRISLSARCIRAARRVSYLVTGTAKAKVLAEIFAHTESAQSYPAALIRSSTGETDYYLDRDAAELLIKC